jgi:hypothetical protein
MERRLAAIISSSIPTSREPTKRMTDSELGKICTTSVRRLTIRFNRAAGLFDQSLGQCAGGKAVYASRSASAASSRSATPEVNLVWATGYNLLAIPIAAGVFSFAGVSLPPAAAAVAMRSRFSLMQQCQGKSS